MTPLQDPTRRLFASKLFAVLAFLFVLSAGWLAGSYFERSKTQLDLSKFWHVYSLISDRYPGDINKSAAVDGAIKGLVDSLDDPYSGYLDELERQRLEEDLSGQFEGIGAVLTEKDGTVVVAEPLPDFPALSAGVKKDDVIVAVDGDLTEGLVLEEVVAKIRGPKGTQVALTLLRGSEELTVTIKRSTISVKSVSYEKRGEVGVIEITQFGDDTVQGVKDAVAALEGQGVAKYLIDLRDNPGGYLNVVAEVTGFFLPPDSVVVKERYQGDATDELTTKGTPLVADKPVYVFINGGSASASEIFAGALQDHNRATVVGEKSYGKGSVQDILPLRGNTALRLTVAEWLTPQGRQINKVGIEPDKKISESSEEAGLSAALRYINSR